MKKMMILIVLMLALAGFAAAQGTVTYAQGTGIQGIDKLGAHQNGGRGCVGCHAPHSGARGNGGSLAWDATANGGTGGYVSVVVEGDTGGEALWGQDLGPVYGTAFNFPTGAVSMDETSSSRLRTGVAMCLSCHDGNVAKGAMMTNQSFAQTAGLLPASYGTQPIPTLLGADGGAFGNYHNDHPVGPAANLGTLSGLRTANLLTLGTSGGTLVVAKGSAFAGSSLERFEAAYGLPTVTNGRAGSGFAVDPAAASVNEAYVVCTTCHTPHSMYTTNASSTNKIAGATSGTFPTYFFVAAPYNPAANTMNGTRASSATQFCRQCHFSGAGGSNEASNINGIPTAF